MFIRGATNKLQIIMGEVIGTSQLPVVVAYADIVANTEPVYDSQYSSTNSLTAVDILGAAGASISRKVLSITVPNVDTVPHFITMRHNTGTSYPVWRGTLSVGDVLNYTDTAGWFVTDASGNLKNTYAGAPNNSYRVILDSSGSHIAGRVAGTYGFGQGDPLMASGGTGSLSPLNIIHIAGADYPVIEGKATKLKIKGSLNVNETAPTGTYQYGLFPITRPGASAGGAGLLVYTIGALVTGSGTNTVSAPAARSQNLLESAEFALPADGYYALGMIQTGTVAASSLLHGSAALMMRNP